MRRHDYQTGKLVDYNLAVYGDSQPLDGRTQKKGENKRYKKLTSPHPYEDVPIGEKLDGNSLNVYIKLKRQENRCKSQLTKAIAQSG